jgi:hypothetical protein
VNVLDENILETQVQELRRRGIRARHIGRDIGRKGLPDYEIRPFLTRQRYPTFVTRDLGFYQRAFCHARYALIILAVPESEVAQYARRVFRHPALNTQAKRMGTVVRASAAGLTLWRLHAEHEEKLNWP